MRILCSNDDGIHSPGLTALEDIAHDIGAEVWTVAPETDQSGMSRSVTLSRPLRVREVGPRRFAVEGTPTDCVQLGVSHLMPRAPDLVLSGINNGHNLAEDVTLSGTIAVAFHAMTLGIPAIALSQSRSDRDAPRWHCARAHGVSLVKDLLDAGWPEDVVMNVNFPDLEPDDVSGIGIVPHGRRQKVELFAEERMDLRQRTYYWFGFKGGDEEPPAGTDLHAIYDGKISVTPLHLQLTEDKTLTRLKDRFGG